MHPGAPYIVEDGGVTRSRSTRSEAPSEEAECDAFVTPQTLRKELSSKRSLPLAERKRLFLSLCRQWHPDKNPGAEVRATAIFQMLQEEKAAFMFISE